MHACHGIPGGEVRRDSKPHRGPFLQFLGALGIFDGDQLTIATGFGKLDRKARPKSFEDKASLFILVLKKGKGK